MPKFITIGYGSGADYAETPAHLRDAAHAHDEHLQDVGSMPVVGVAGAPTQVRNHHQSGVTTKQGPFLRSDLPIAGFAVLEARDLDEAVRLVADTPCAVANGVVEVWPLIN